MGKYIKALILICILSTIGLTNIVYADEISGTGVLINSDGTVTNNTSVESQNVQTNQSLAESSEVDWLHGFKEVSEEDLQKKLDDHSVESAMINSQTGNLYVILENKESYKVVKASRQLVTYLKLYGIEVQTSSFIEEVVKQDSIKTNTDNAINTVCVLAMMGLIGVPIYFIFKQNKQVASIGAVREDVAKTSEGVPKIKFEDVEGIEELKSDIMRLVDCLKNPKKYQKMGARVPKGVILYGPPGTGKTLIAKAIAGEAKVPFFSMVGSDFVEKYVGVGASRVRELYKKARKEAPCIVFIDEIDAVASQRGRDENSERDQTINALLAELDGFKGSENIITICATNRLDMLDSAFKRAGRFDLKLAVGLPDKKGRERILEIHSKDKKLGEDIDLKAIANKTVGFSGAELEALLNEAALVAVGKDRNCITNLDIEDAFFKIVMQGNKKKRDKITETNKVVAWHEAGHTLATKLLTDDIVSSVTIIGSASGAGGVTFRQPQEENELQSKKYLEDTVKVMYAGRAAEEIYFKDKDMITIGASQDIKQATSIIKDYVSTYGMGDKGMLDMSQFSRDFSSVVNEASKIAKSLYEDTVKLLSDNHDTLKILAECLLVNETLDELEIDNIINGNKVKLDKVS